MTLTSLSSRPAWLAARFRALSTAGLLGAAAACAPSEPVAVAPAPEVALRPIAEVDAAPTPDPREGLESGLFDAEKALWNLRLLSETRPPEEFVGVTNSDLAFTGKYAVQGNYNGFQVWDISNPTEPVLVEGYVCPASQSDVSVYENLLFVSGEGYGGRLDCGTQGVEESVSEERLRGIRIFDISDIENPEYIGNVQTCRGSHTHTVLKDPQDDENVYVYVSGSAPVRPAEELPGCVSAPPSEDPNSALFRIEVIKVPLDNPAQAAIVSSPRIFEGLVAPPEHGMAPADIEAVERAKARGAFTAVIEGNEMVLPSGFIHAQLDSVVTARGGTGAPTAADSAALREALPGIIAAIVGPAEDEGEGPRPGPTQCHDITVYPAIGLAGGACEGYGLLLDISDPTNPVRIDAASDENFAYWHSATFNNEGTKVIFTDEWGGGGGAKCRASDPEEWGANAIFTIEGRELAFEEYYKLPVAQTEVENCVAHNGSLIPIPGRDVMVQAWYQGGVSVFDFTDPENPVEIAFFDRGPINAERMASGGSWSVYWYNGNIVSSEIARGLDILQLTPSEYLTQNEIEAARSVELDYLNAQGQPHYEWPATFALARAYVDQLDRADALPAERIAELRAELADEDTDGLASLAAELESGAAATADVEKVRELVEVLRELAA